MAYARQDGIYFFVRMCAGIPPPPVLFSSLLITPINPYFTQIIFSSLGTIFTFMIYHSLIRRIYPILVEKWSIGLRNKSLV